MENSSRYEGKLVRWNEEKGFGFIQSENRGKDIFLTNCVTPIKFQVQPLSIVFQFLDRLKNRLDANA